MSFYRLQTLFHYNLSESLRRPTTVPISLPDRSGLWDPPSHPRPLPRPLLPTLDEGQAQVPAKAESSCSQDATSALGPSPLKTTLHQGPDLSLVEK